MKFKLSIYLSFLFLSLFAQDSNFEKGLEAFNQKDYAKAVSFYSLELKNNRNSNIYFNRASSNFQLKNYSKAIEDLTIVIDKEPSDIQAWSLRASTYYQLHLLGKGMFDAEKALNLDSSFHKAHNTIGLCLYDLHHYEQAIEEFNKALIIEEKPQYYFNRANAFQELGLFEKALTDYNKAFKMNPKIAFITAIGNYYYAKKDYSKAIEKFNTAILLDTNNTTTIFNRAVCYYANSNNLLAIKDFQKVLHLNKNDIDTKWYLTLCHYELKNYEEALKYYSMVEFQDENYFQLKTIDKSELTNKMTLGNYFWYTIALIILLFFALFFVSKIYKK